MELTPVDRPNSLSDAEWSRLAAYIAGEGTEADRRETERWLATSPAAQQAFVSSGDDWRPQGQTSVPAVDVIRGWQRLSHRLALPNTISPSRQSTLPVGGRRWNGKSIATISAIAVACVVMVMAIVTNINGTRPKQTTSWFTYSTPNGQRAMIQLPDGGTVLLNVASRLDVPTDYAAGNRALRLRGEAVFTIQNQQRHPFSVTTGTTTARVLGTSFLVRRYDTDTSVIVAVREGKVSLDSLVLTANQQVEVGPKGKLRVIEAEMTRFGFSGGRLILKNRRLIEAIPELNRWFDVDIRLGNQILATRRLSGELATGNAATVADLLELMFDVRVMRNGRVLTLYTK